MRKFTSVLDKVQSDNRYYCVRIMNCLEVDEQEIFISCPLCFQEFVDFIERRLDDKLQDRLKVVESYSDLTPREKEEMYSLEEFGKILDAIEANLRLHWSIFYEKGNGSHVKCVKIDEVQSCLAELGDKVTRICPSWMSEGWQEA